MQSTFALMLEAAEASPRLDLLIRRLCTRAVSRFGTDGIRSRASSSSAKHISDKARSFSRRVAKPSHVNWAGLATGGRRQGGFRHSLPDGRVCVTPLSAPCAVIIVRIYHRSSADMLFQTERTRVERGQPSWVLTGSTSMSTVSSWGFWRRTARAQTITRAQSCIKVWLEGHAQM